LPCKALAQRELAAPGLGQRRRDRHLAAELVGRPAMPLPIYPTSGAWRIDLWPRWRWSCKRTGCARARGSAKRCVSLSSPAILGGCRGSPAEPDAQKLGLASGAVELMSVGVAADHDRGT
jgi:hypothetical protein